IFRASAKSVRLPVVILAAALSAGLMSGARADPPAEAPAPRPVHHSTAAPSTSSAYRQLKREVGSFKEQLAGLKSQLASLQSSLDEMNGSQRLNDLEHAVSEINSKTVSGTSAAEETKTQVLEANQKLKVLAEAMEQLRDRTDRLQQQIIAQKALIESGPA